MRFGPSPYQAFKKSLRIMGKAKPGVRRTKAWKAQEAELKLLLALASGRTTFVQVSEDAEDFSLSGHEFASLVSSNAARGITARLEDVIGSGKSSLHFLPARFKADDALNMAA